MNDRKKAGAEPPGPVDSLPPVVARDYGSEEHRWDMAVGHWFAGNLQPLADLLLHHTAAIPSHVRPLLADLVLGKVKKPRGRPQARSGGRERDLATKVFEAWDACGTKDEAIAQVAEADAAKPKIPETTLTGVVNKVQREGYTFKVWQTYIKKR